MKKWLIGLIVAIYMVIGAVAWAQPHVPPVPTGSIYVQDYAGVLSGETKAKLKPSLALNCRADQSPGGRGYHEFT